MRRVPTTGIAVLGVAIVLASVARAKAVAVMVNRPAALQAIQADVIITGKVSEIEKELAKATQFPGAKDQIAYQVAVINIKESIRGANGLTTVRIGYLPGNNSNPMGGPGGGPLRPNIRRVPQVALTLGQEGCFFLVKHHEADFYVLLPGGVPLEKKAADFDKQLQVVKNVVKIDEDPMSALKTASGTDRPFTACVIVQKYRSYPLFNNGKQPTQENIPADQSKLIMQIMADMEWGKFEQKDGIGVNLQNMFGMLGVQPGQHGFNPPKFQPNQQDYGKIYGEYVKKWVKDNAETYRIQRWVANR